MSSAGPNKRRKTNNHQTLSPQKPRGLDFFFGKKPANDSTAGLTTENVGLKEEKEKETDDEKERAEEELSDEALARKLQAEWDEQDRLQLGQSTGSGAKKGNTMDGAEIGRLMKHEKEEDEDVNGNSRNGSLGEMETESTIKVEEDTVAKAEQVSVIKDEKKDDVEPPSSIPDEAPKPINPFASLDKPHTLSLQSATADNDTTTYEIPFDQSPLTFDPADYASSLQATWASSANSATYALLTHTFVLINSTTSRIKIVDTLTNLLRTLIVADPSSLLPAVWLATNSISPPYIDLELGLGGSAISKALKKVCGLDNAGLKKLYDKHGDAGDVAFEAKKRQSLTLRKPKTLTIKSVFDSLVKIANAKGTGSVEVKQRLVERLVQDSRGAEESRYIVRTLVQHLRIGAVKTTMLIALSRAFLLSKPESADFATLDRAVLAKLSKQELAEVWAPPEEVVKACFARRPNYNDLVPTLLDIGVQRKDELLLRCGLAMHIPLRPMLGGITRDLPEMLQKLEGREFTCEYKYDGQRAQVHCDSNGKVTIFSRHLEVMTDKYPDLVALVPKIRGEGVNSFIIEGEVTAIDQETGALKPFQVLSNRARKDVVIGSVKVDVCLFAFDLMYLNGEELLGRPLRERRSLLRSLFVELPHHFTWVKSIDATSADEDAVSEFFKQAVEDKCEGFMAKVLDNLPTADRAHTPGLDSFGLPIPEPKPPPTPSKRKKAAAKPKPSKNTPITTEEALPTEEQKKTNTRRKALLATYEPDKRLDSWLKVKKDYNTTADTIDLIPIGAWHGSGRKSKWWSPILLAARNPETGSLEAVTKCMAGFTDVFYAANKERYAEGGENVVSKPGYVEYVGSPAVWFHPQEVWEIAFADITLSPTYTAALGLISEERGLSMRFPRFLRARPDKGIEEASSTDFLAELYRKQEGRARAAAANGSGSGGGKVEDLDLEGFGDEGLE